MGLFSRLLKTERYNPKASNYKMETLEDINSIPVPTSQFEYNCDFTESIEYVLQRKATQFKKAGQMDLAIACLKKSNEIMPFAPMTYTPKDYERLEKYLKLAGRFDEARGIHENVQSTLSNQNRSITEKQLELSDLSDYIEVPRLNRPCSECAKYHDRIYSKNCKNGFPDTKIFLEYINSKVCSCYLSFFPFLYEISVYPAGRKPEGKNPYLCKYTGGISCERYLAWSGTYLCDLGWYAWRAVCDHKMAA